MLTCLRPGATTRQLIRAAADNHTSWFRASALASDGDVYQTPDASWTVTAQEATIAFPQLSADSAGAILDAIITQCRERHPTRVGCWSLSPSVPRNLGALLAARGFGWGWCPHWMALNLSEKLTSFALPDGVSVAVDDACDWEVDDLPYYNRDDTASLHALTQAEPRHTWHFAARLNGAVVGHSTLHVTTGKSGIAGIYNVGVVPSARHQGIGTVVSQAACQFAQNLGYQYALLNSAAEALYLKLGFRSLGYGQTWWMHTKTLNAAAPTPEQVAFAEALGRGDVRALDVMPPSYFPADWNAPLPNDMTPMELAVKVGKPAAAKWLMARGATLDVLHAWDLRWKTRARRLLMAKPALINRRAGDWQITLLHEAVERNDIALVIFLLSAHPDLTLIDSQFQATPLDWAQHLNRTEIVALLQQHASPDM